MAIQTGGKRRGAGRPPSPEGLIAPVDADDPEYRTQHCNVCHTRLCVDETAHTCQDCLGVVTVASLLGARASSGDLSRLTPEQLAERRARVDAIAARVQREYFAEQVA